jgi:hypothetical protein
MRWAGPVTCMEEMRNAYKILVGTPEWLRRARSKWRILLKWIINK